MTHTNSILEITNIKKKIYQNKKTYFIIKKSEKWKYAIELSIKTKEKIIIENLYQIFKCFIEEKLFICHSIAFGLKKDEKMLIVEKIASYKIKKKDIFEFEDWIFKTIYNESLYKIKNEDIFCIYFMFNKDFIDKYNYVNKTDILNKLYPKIKTIDKLKVLKEKRIRILFKKYKWLKFLK